jgi:hypothetical protein
MRTLLKSTLVAGLLLSAISTSRASVLTVTFDQLDATGGTLTGSTVTSYLASYGISVSGLTPGTYLLVADVRNIYSGDLVVPPSPYNIFSQGGSLDPVSFTLGFSTPLESFAFTRPGFHVDQFGVTHPAWQAYAFDSNGTELASASEPLLSSFSDVPAASYNLNGPGITSVRFDSQNEHFAGFGAVLLDNLVLTSSVPEPGTLTLAGIGGLVMAAYVWRSRR